MLAAGQGVGREGDLPADVPSLGKDTGIGHLPTDTKTDQRTGVRVDDSFDVRPRAVDTQVKGTLRGGWIWSLELLPAKGDFGHIAAFKIALIDPRRGDPDMTVFVADGDIAAGGRGHVSTVDASHGQLDLVAGMKEIEIHGRDAGCGVRGDLS